MICSRVQPQHIGQLQELLNIQIVSHVAMEKSVHMDQLVKQLVRKDFTANQGINCFAMQGILLLPIHRAPAANALIIYNANRGKIEMLVTSISAQ